MIRASERSCQETIIAAAILAGWFCHAERPAQRGDGRWSTPIQGHVGFPDLVLVKGGRVIVAELKRHPRNPDPAQVQWISRLQAAGIDTRLIWVPEEMPAFLAELIA